MTAAEILVSNYHFLTNQERRQSANTRRSIDALWDVGNYLCVFFWRYVCLLTVLRPKELQEAEYRDKKVLKQ